jgi:hypothetical protein
MGLSGMGMGCDGMVRLSGLFLPLDVFGIGSEEDDVFEDGGDGEVLFGGEFGAFSGGEEHGGGVCLEA